MQERLVLRRRRPGHREGSAPRGARRPGPRRGHRRVRRGAGGSRREQTEARKGIAAATGRIEGFSEARARAGAWRENARPKRHSTGSGAVHELGEDEGRRGRAGRGPTGRAGAPAGRQAEGPGSHRVRRRRGSPGSGRSRTRAAGHGERGQWQRARRASLGLRHHRVWSRAPRRSNQWNCWISSVMNGAVIDGAGRSAAVPGSAGRRDRSRQSRCRHPVGGVCGSDGPGPAAPSCRQRHPSGGQGGGGSHRARPHRAGRRPPCRDAEAERARGLERGAGCRRHTIVVRPGAGHRRR